MRNIIQKESLFHHRCKIQKVKNKLFRHYLATPRNESYRSKMQKTRQPQMMEHKQVRNTIE